ncbi:MAG: hypothetical protein ABSC95_29855 [Acetobacteraceae bacterium]|jgi:multidrug efflux pump subunit AcrB
MSAVQQAEVELGVPATLTGSFQGTAQAFQASLSTTPYLIAAALPVVCLILGVNHELQPRDDHRPVGADSSGGGS